MPAAITGVPTAKGPARSCRRTCRSEGPAHRRQQQLLPELFKLETRQQVEVVGQFGWARMRWTSRDRLQPPKAGPETWSTRAEKARSRTGRPLAFIRSADEEARRWSVSGLGPSGAASTSTPLGTITVAAAVPAPTGPGGGLRTAIRREPVQGAAGSDRVGPDSSAPAWSSRWGRCRPPTSLDRQVSQLLAGVVGQVQMDHVKVVFDVWRVCAA